MALKPISAEGRRLPIHILSPRSRRYNNDLTFNARAPIKQSYVGVFLRHCFNSDSARPKCGRMRRATKIVLVSVFLWKKQKPVLRK